MRKTGIMVVLVGLIAVGAASAYMGGMQTGQMNGLDRQMMQDGMMSMESGMMMPDMGMGAGGRMMDASMDEIMSGKDFGQHVRVHNDMFSGDMNPGMHKGFSMMR